MRRLLERLITYAFLLMVVGMVTVLFLGAGLHERTVEEGNTASNFGAQLCETLIYAGSGVLILAYYRRVLVAARTAWPFLLVGGFALLSSMWSVDPAITIRRSAVLLSTSIFGIYLASRRSTVQLQALLLHFFLILVGASLLLLVAAPSYALDTFHNDAFRGITIHKNVFGNYMGMFVLLALTYPFRKRWGGAHWGTILLAGSMLVASRAGTALISAVIAVIVAPMLYVVRFPKRQAVPLAVLGLILLAVLGMAASQFSGSVLDLLGKDSTLTGRAAIWQGARHSISKRPLLGYGYDAFWQGLRGESLSIIATVNWLVPHAHNGYLEALLGLGAAGMGLLALCVLRTAKDAVGYVQRQKDLSGLWPFAFAVYFLCHATAEASLLEREGLGYLLFVALSTALALDRQGAHAREGLAPRCEVNGAMLEAPGPPRRACWLPPPAPPARAPA